jgi:hypothetical protein
MARDTPFFQLVAFSDTVSQYPPPPMALKSLRKINLQNNIEVLWIMMSRQNTVIYGNNFWKKEQFT